RLDVHGDRPFDRILSDLRMPGLSGDQLLAHLKARGRGEETRLVFMTGDHASPEAARVLKAAGVPYMVKPFTLAKVMEVLNGAGERPSR
ncbi:MAG: response regulator, partial [Gemmatimonadales bacterium]